MKSKRTGSINCRLGGSAPVKALTCLAGLVTACSPSSPEQEDFGVENFSGRVSAAYCEARNDVEDFYFDFVDKVAVQFDSQTDVRPIVAPEYTAILHPFPMLVPTHTWLQANPHQSEQKWDVGPVRFLLQRSEGRRGIRIRGSWIEPRSEFENYTSEALFAERVGIVSYALKYDDPNLDAEWTLCAKGHDAMMFFGQPEAE